MILNLAGWCIESIHGQQFTETPLEVHCLTLNLSLNPRRMQFLQTQQHGQERLPTRFASRSLARFGAVMKDTFPYSAPDIAQLAREVALAAQSLPALSHVQWLGVLAKAAGARNYQQWRAQSQQRPIAALAPTAAEPPAAAIPKTVSKALGHFDDQGRLTRWPTQFSIQRLVLWGVWMRLRGGAHRWDERGITATLKLWNTFDDPATLRRELITMGMMDRADGGRVYWKLEKPRDGVSGEAQMLMNLLRPRRIRT
jgi:hypothetical protein